MWNKRNERVILTSLKNQGLLDDSQVDDYNGLYQRVDIVSDILRFLSLVVGVLSFATMITGFISSPNPKSGDDLGYSIDSDGDGVPDSSYIVTVDDNGNKVSGFDLNNDGSIDIPVIHDDIGRFSGFDTNGDGVADKFIPKYNQETGQITSIDIDGHGHKITLSGDSEKVHIRFPSGEAIDILYQGDEVFIDTNGDGSGDVKVLFNKDGIFTGFDIRGENGFDGQPDSVSLEDLGIPNQYSKYMGVQNQNINVRGGMTVTPPVDPGVVDGGDVDGGDVDGGDVDGGDVDGGGVDGDDQKKYNITLDSINGVNTDTYNVGVLGIGFISSLGAYVNLKERDRNKPTKDSVIRKKENQRTYDIILDKGNTFLRIAFPLAGYGMLLGSVISYAVAGSALPTVLIVALSLSTISIALFIAHKCLNIAERTQINEVNEAIWTKIENTESYKLFENHAELKQLLKIKLVEASNNNKDFDIESLKGYGGSNHLYNAIKEIAREKTIVIEQPFKSTKLQPSHQEGQHTRNSL